MKQKFGLLGSVLAAGITTATPALAKTEMRDFSDRVGNIVFPNGFGGPAGSPLYDILENPERIRLKNIFGKWGAIFPLPTGNHPNSFFISMGITDKIINGLKSTGSTDIYMSPYPIVSHELRGVNGEIIATVGNGFEKFVYKSSGGVYFMGLTRN